MQIETRTDAGANAGLKQNDNRLPFPCRSGSSIGLMPFGCHPVQSFVRTERQLFCPASVLRPCRVNNRLNGNRYRRPESLERARGQKTPHGTTEGKRTALKWSSD